MVHIPSLLVFAILPLLVASSPIAKSPSTGSTAIAKNASPKGQSKPLLPSAATGKGNSKGSKSTQRGKPSKAVQKMPNHMKGLPKGAHMLAWDEKNHKLIAYDKNKKHLGTVKAPGGKPGSRAKSTKGSKPIVKSKSQAAKGGKSDVKKPTGGSQKLGSTRTPKTATSVLQRRDSNVTIGGCTALSKDDAQKLPGWATLKSVAEKNWGTGSYNVVTNDRDYPDMPATVCVDTATAMLVKDANPSCTNSTVKADGQLSNGTVSLTQTYGTDYTSTMTVTQESDISVGSSISCKVGIEDIADVTTTATFDATFKNTLASATQSTTSTSLSLGVTKNLPANSGQSCLFVRSSHCDITGTGKVRYLASGWVWFEYNDRTQGHYKWALNLDSTLSNPDDRSSFMGIKAAISSETKSGYSDKC